MFVGGLGVGEFVFADEASFLGPALVDALEAPFGAAAVADRFAIDEDEDGVGVGAGEYAEGDPTAFVDVHGEFGFVHGAVGGNGLFGDGIAVDDEFDGDGAGGVDAGAFDVPVRLFVELAVLEIGVGCFVEARGDFGGNGDGARFLERKFAFAFAHADVIDAKINDVAFAVADVVAAEAEAFAPVFVVEFAVELHVGAAEANAFAVDAGEIGFATDAGAVADIEGVIPDIEFPGIGCVDGGDEIDGTDEFAVGAGNFVGNVDDVFVGADAFEGRDGVVGEFGGIDFEAPAGMGRAGDGALFFGPLEGVEAEGGPMMHGIAAGIHLLLEAKEAEMAGLMRAETGDFDVVAEDVGIFGFLVVLAGEKLFLVIEARAPGEVRADFEVFALAMAGHVGCVNAFSGFGVMGATGGVDVVIAGPPAHFRGIDPAFDLELEFLHAGPDLSVSNLGD